jgi:Tol biopolymer transport system component
MSPPSLAYLAGGRLHLKVGEAAVRVFDSAFGQQMRDRHVEIQQKHSWKAEGRGARFHGSAQRIRDVRAAPGREHIACSVAHSDGTASIAVMGLDATDLREVTEGDAQDRFPSWAPGSGARLVYQSASVGRDAAGRMAALGPSAIRASRSPRPARARRAPTCAR